MQNYANYRSSFVTVTVVLLALSTVLVASEGNVPRVWYSTNFYGHYVNQDLEIISTASTNSGIVFISDHLRLFKYNPRYRADYGNSARLSDDGYSGVILAIPEQEDNETLSFLREFVESGGNIVVLYNAVSAHYDRNVSAFKDVFSVEFKHRQIASKFNLFGASFHGQELCYLWKGLKIGSKSWEKIGVDAYIIPEGEGWQDEVYITDKDGDRYCISAVRKVGKGLILFQVAPNNCIHDNRGPGRLHETYEFFFPKHISDYDNLEGFMRLVKFTSAGKVQPTMPEPIPSHEVTASDRNNLRNREVCVVSGTVLLEDNGPACGQFVEIYQERSYNDFWGSSTSKENRHVVKTDSNGRFTVALTVPGYYKLMISPQKGPYHYCTQIIQATLGGSQNLEVIVRKYRQVEIKWCYSPGKSGSFTKRGVIMGETILSPDGLCRVKFTKKGLVQVRNSDSDFMIIQRDDKLFLRNFDVCQSGHGIIELKKESYSSVNKVSPDSQFTTRLKPMMEPGKVIIIKTYDGKGYAKLLVESVSIKK